MTVKRREWLIDQLSRQPKEPNAEIVDAAIVPIAPAGGITSRTSGMILSALLGYCQSVNQGFVLPSSAVYLIDLPNRGSFSPDVSYCLDKTLVQDFIEGAPVFAAEVRSKHDYSQKAERAILAKIADYFAAGTLVVWDVDALREKTIRVYRASQPDQPTVYGINDTAEAEPALPGWRVEVKTLLA